MPRTHESGGLSGKTAQFMWTSGKMALTLDVRECIGRAAHFERLTFIGLVQNSIKKET